mmetsp:Transcript_14260/g.29753  ORF Transcript_14260/g.29753 Transcript_14260/m.29753 type:complete len:206 (+) Transcript_14260:75-692(+)
MLGRSRARDPGSSHCSVGAPGVQRPSRATANPRPNPRPMGATLPAGRAPVDRSASPAGLPSGASTLRPQKVAAKGVSPNRTAEDGVLKRQPREVPRWYSVSSQGALAQLAAVEMEVLSVQHRVEELAALPLDTEEQRGQARTELAQLEAEAHKLECQGVDNVYTSDLDSGKAEAKDLKKALLSRIETVLERIEETFRRLKMPSSP